LLSIKGLAGAGKEYRKIPRRRKRRNNPARAKREDKRPQTVIDERPRFYQRFEFTPH